MSSRLKAHAETDAAAPCAVEVVRAVEAPAPEVWKALTDPAIVSQWFGAVSSEIKVGERLSLEFGDGDFYVLDILEVDPPHTLKYCWRFLSIGPVETITWRICPKEGGCLVIVTDSEPYRAREEAHQRRRIWLDFTKRLERFLRKGNPTSYSWRGEFNASVEFAGEREAIWHQVIKPEKSAWWFPLGGADLKVETSFKIADGIEPSEFHIRAVEFNSPNRAQFSLNSKDWLYPTTFNLTLRPRGHDLLLTVSHFGWEAINWLDDYQKQQRVRFSKLWIKSLLRFTLDYVRRGEIPKITPDQLNARLGQSGLHIFDSNPPSHWESGHIPGATYIGPVAFTPDTLPQDKRATLVFYCASAM